MAFTGPMLKVLSKDEIERIHNASIHILENVGMKVLNSKFMKIMEDNGAHADFKSRIVKLPSDVFKEFIKKIPNSWTVYARNPDNNINIGSGKCRFLSSGGQTRFVNPIEKERRECTKKDLIDAIKVGDALKNINIVGAMALPISDIPFDIVDIYSYAQLVKVSSKTIFTWIYDKRSAPYIIRIFELLAGGAEELKKKPMLWYFGEPTSPLTLGDNVAEITMLFAEKGLPLAFGPMVMASSSGPTTLAGTIAQENAEILFCSVAAQMIHPGVPVEYGGIPHILDQKTGNISFGSPEQGLMAAAICQIGRYYGFPVHINVGLTDSKVPDAQSGLEKGITVLMGALSGAELFGHMGISGADQGACLEQLVIDDEMASYIRRVLRSFEVDAGTIADEVVKEVGPGGSFLTHAHTFKNLRNEFWFPTLFDRNNWERWVKAGAKDTLLAAGGKVNKILSSHQPELLENDLGNEIDLIVEDARKALLQKL